MSIKKFFSVCFVLGVLACRAGANDSSSSGIGDRWRMLQREDTQVQMVREHVRIVPSGEEFQTTADFVFRNHGPATTVVMGFPESGDSPPEISLHSFCSWVDGRRVRVARHVVASKEDDEWNALWTKTVRFARNQTRRVRVRYVSSSGGGATDGAEWISYNFTGGNWRGEVEESVLDVELPRGAYLLPEWGEDQWTWTSYSQRHGNRFRFRWTHWQAQKNFRFNYYPTFPNDLLKHVDSASVASGVKPRYQPASYDVPLLPFVGGSALPDCILQGGLLWVSAKAFSPRWDEKRRGVILTSGDTHAFVSADGATERSSLWPLAPDGSFWIAQGGYDHVLLVPAREVAQKLKGRFELDLAHGQAVWVQGTVRKILRADPSG